jgi:hypothetical protein
MNADVERAARKSMPAKKAALALGVLGPPADLGDGGPLQTMTGELRDRLSAPGYSRTSGSSASSACRRLVGFVVEVDEVVADVVVVVAAGRQLGG